LSNKQVLFIKESEAMSCRMKKKLHLYRNGKNSICGEYHFINCVYKYIINIIKTSEAKNKQFLYSTRVCSLAVSPINQLNNVYSIFKMQKKMKKLFFPAAVIAAITLASCSRQAEVIDMYSSGESTPIGFRTFVGKSGGANTKALITTTDKVILFRVHAYNTAQEEWKDYTPPVDADVTPNLMQYQDVHKSTGEDGSVSWIYYPTKYWPAADGKVSFFAYTSVNTEGGLPPGLGSVTFPTGTMALGPAFIYEAHNAITMQRDVVGAIALNKKQSDGAVSLVFEHLLSRIGFTAKTSQDYTSAEIKVTQLYVKTNDGANIERKASFQFGTSAFETKNWTIIPGTYFTVTGYSGEVMEGSVTLGTDAKRLLRTDGAYHIMLPPNQTIAKEAFTVQIFYTITGTPYNTKIKLPAKGLDLDLGKQYTFNFTFSLNAVEFSGVSTSGWDDGSAHQPGDTGL
jgi:hypothetical protein